jgi:hypothetical protein
VREPEVYTIEQILSRRFVEGRKQYKVKWLGWPDKFNSWVSEEELQNILPTNQTEDVNS